MSQPAIHVEGLGKRFTIGASQTASYGTLRDSISQFASRLTRRSKPQKPDVDLWALRDVNFRVEVGEVVGIIGGNGAGKSTLLKVLSRITEPSEGQARIRGRVGSLLEVGTGFHPELSGRENIYLNGAILGMTRNEIRSKFDEIVSFSEVEKFIDTPVKHYSSGMYLRLAFAVAAHLEPEILMVDEVLAVGDHNFQNKCLGKMNEVAKQGRTVLFVSHNMSAVHHLCTRAILLQKGSVAYEGDPGSVISRYLTGGQASTEIDLHDWHDRRKKGPGKITHFSVTSADGGAVRVGGSLIFHIRAEFESAVLDPTFEVVIENGFGEPLLDLRSVQGGLRLGRCLGPVEVEVRVDNVGLYPGRYLLSPCIMDGGCLQDIDFVRQCLALQVEPAPGPHGDLRLNSRWGRYYVPSDWKSVTQD